MPQANLQLEIDRSDEARTRVRELPLGALAPGSVRFRIERFALTANNVTYAKVGDMLGYWDFFPTEAGWGNVPAMGWAKVVESSHPEVEPGGRFFGWYPLARYVDVAVSVSPDGLRDEGAHRAKHAPIYRAFMETSRDPFHQEGVDAEDRHALLRGLFLTAFLADDWFDEQDYLGAKRAIVLSASSKTAIGYAQCASAREGLQVVGLTSPRNVAFVESLGWYDRVLPYDAIESLPNDEDAVSIDMAGSGELLARVHRRLGERLRHSMAIGISHHDAPPPANLPGPKPEMFFAPSQVSKRVADWGAEGYRDRIAEALRSFVDASTKWLELERSYGPEAAQRVWSTVYAGGVPPSTGHIVSLHERG